MAGTGRADRARLCAIALAAALTAVAAPAAAQRPVLAGEGSFGAAGGQTVVHYATTGADAVPMADADTNGVPDFVDEVAATAEDAVEHYLALGFRRPLDDGARGNDGRIDIYLRNLNGADGSAGTDGCTADRCIGFVAAENDYAGYSYPTVTEGIRSVIPHELFHLVQYAYSNTQSSSWTEGSAVWATENLYGDGNGDFERFLSSFVTRSFRPFERAIGGFGDGYPYGAALWPYFLEQRYGVDTVVATWAGCETANFLDAGNRAIGTSDGGLDQAWIEFTRWNAFTGPRAARGMYPKAATWPVVPRETAIADRGTIYIEGLSARYVPIAITQPSSITVSTAASIKLAAWIVADDKTLTDGIALRPDGASHAANVDPGSYLLVVTGLTRNSIATAVDVAIGPPVPDSDDGGSCSSSRHPPPALLALIAGLLIRRRASRARALR
jgi:hypothetical protein